MTATVTRSGRESRAPRWHKNYTALALTLEEMAYQVRLKEIAMMEFSTVDYWVDHYLAGVGDGLGGGFVNTNKLKVMKFNEAMQAAEEGWTKAVDKDHDCMIENKA